MHRFLGAGAEQGCTGRAVMDVLCLSPSVQQPRGPSLCLGKVSQMFLFSVSPPRCAEHLGFPPSPHSFCSVQHSSPGVESVVLVLNLHVPKGMVLRT